MKIRLKIFKQPAADKVPENDQVIPNVNSLSDFHYLLKFEIYCFHRLS